MRHVTQWLIVLFLVAFVIGVTVEIFTGEYIPKLDRMLMFAVLWEVMLLHEEKEGV